MVIGQIPKPIGFIYALVMILVMTYLWYSGRCDRRYDQMVFTMPELKQRIRKNAKEQREGYDS